MKKLPFMAVRVLVGSLLLLVMPVIVHAQGEEAKAGPPPVGQPMVREGTLAVKLEFALGVGTTEDEAEAESRLGEAGIIPKNGWIADYPVTPDIVAELQAAVSDAVASGKLPLGKDEALKRLDSAITEAGLPVKPYDGEPGAAKPPVAENYPNPAVINNYYYNQGPPVVTYYAPPPDYYYLYSWVPFPFWWTGFWFPGFFILNDFHRTVFISNRVFFVSNHFNDVRIHRVFRIDPVARFRGRTFAGIGVTDRRGFISTGVPRSDRTIFNGPRTRAVPGGRMTAPPSFRGGRMVAPPSTRGGRTVAPPSGGRMVAPPSGGRMVAPPSGGRMVAPPSGSRMVAPPSGGRMAAPPSGGRMVRPPAGGGGGQIERGGRR